MVSGYFCNDKEDNRYYVRKALRILRMFVVSAILYMLMNVLMYGFNFVKQEITLVNLAKLLLFNAPQISSAHLWFLLSLTYSYVCFAFFRKHKRALLLYATFALIGHIMMIEICPHIGINIFINNHPLIRNAWLFGFPFFIIGHIYRSINTTKIKSNMMIVLIVLGLLLSFLENAYVSSESLQELYIGTIVSSISLFGLCITHPSLGRNSWIVYMGRELSLPIYILHPLVGHFILKVFEWENTYLRSMTIILATIIVSILEYYLVRLCLRRK